MLRATIGYGLTLPLRARLSAQAADAAQSRPQEDDRFVFALGSRAGQTVTPDDVGLGEAQILAYPKDPVTDTVRDGSRLNQVIVVRLDPADLDADTAARAADGIVAYSGVCSHTGCDVSDWLGGARTFLCPCHESEFNPARGAEVEGGPAPRRLAALPLKIVDGALRAAGSFIGRVGAAEQ